MIALHVRIAHLFLRGLRIWLRMQYASVKCHVIHRLVFFFDVFQPQQIHRVVTLHYVKRDVYALVWLQATLHVLGATPFVHKVA